MKFKLAKCIFYDQKGDIAVQERGDASKRGEKYGFWGGGVEKGESPKQAVLRELEEELGYKPREMRFWKKFVIQFNDLAEIYVYVSPITDELLKVKVLEGAGLAIMKIDYARKNINSLFGGMAILDGLEEYLKLRPLRK